MKRFSTFLAENQGNSALHVVEHFIEMLEKIGHPAIMERFVVRNGKSFGGAPYKGKRGTPKLCFMNAYKMSVANNWPYYEGYLVLPNVQLPIHHAWCVDNGQVVDPTIDRPEECSYIGVHIDRGTLDSEMLKHKVYGVLDTPKGVNANLFFRLDPQLQQVVEQKFPAVRLR